MPPSPCGRFARMNTPPFGAAKGFTLLELLVVIAIVAALTGLLLPAITTARQSAQALRCASSLRQIGMAAFAYTADHNDQVVAAHGNNGDPWTVRLADYLEAWKGAPTAWPSARCP